MPLKQATKLTAFCKEGSPSLREHCSSWIPCRAAHTYCGGNQQTNQQVIFTCLTHVNGQQNLQGSHAKALESFLKTSSEATFDFLEAALNSPQTSSEMAADLWKAVHTMVQQLVKADNLAFARLVLTHFPEKHDGMIGNLALAPEIQYR